MFVPHFDTKVVWKIKYIFSFSYLSICKVFMENNTIVIFSNRRSIFSAKEWGFLKGIPTTGCWNSLHTSEQYRPNFHSTLSCEHGSDLFTSLVLAEKVHESIRYVYATFPFPMVMWWICGPAHWILVTVQIADWL